MKESLLRLNDALYLLCIWISGLAILVMSLIIPWGIFTRYVLGSGSQWPEPIAILLMVVFTFFGAAAGYRAGAHIAVGMITQRLHAGLQFALAKAVTVLMGIVAAFMAWYGIKLCIELWGQSISELPWMPVGFSYLPVPMGGLITLMFVIEHLIYGSQAKRAVVTYDHDSLEVQ
ncbi:MAG: TRAP transporter small permease [Brachymonas sp.]|nr:TRAP transporter small permease [Brachymonas sp.]